MPEHVRITDLSKVVVAERAAGGLLLFSALVDGVLSYDILLLNAQHTSWILSVGYLVLIPAIVAAVVVVSLSTTSASECQQPQVEPSMLNGFPEQADMPTNSVKSLDEDKAEETAQIMTRFDVLMREQQVFKDPDLSLNRLARKLGIPARKISAAVNQTHKQNISKVINVIELSMRRFLLSKVMRQ